MPIQRPRPVLLGVWVAFLLHLTAAACVAQPPPAQQKPLPKQTRKARFWTTHWSFQDVDIKRLFSRLESIGLKIPVDASGDVSAEFDVSVPWTSLRDGKAYRFSGHIKSKRLRLENLLLEDFDGEVNYVDGVLHLADVSGRWSDIASADHGGSFKGVAMAELLPRGDFQADIHAQTLAIGPLHDLLVSETSQSAVRPIQGTVSGDIHFQAPMNQLRDVTTWNADADLEINNFRFGDSMALSARTGPLQIRDGVVQAGQVEVASSTSPQLQIGLAVQVELIGRKRFQFSIRGNDIPLAGLTEMVVPDGNIAAGKLDIDAFGKGELASEVWEVQGRVGSPRLTILGQDLGLMEHQFKFDQQQLELRAIDPVAGDHENAMLVKEVAAEYTLSEESLRITNIAARLFNGTFEGQATFARIETLTHHAKFTWRDLQLVFNVAPILKSRAKISATTSGMIDWSLQPGALGSPQAHQGVAHVRLEQIAMGKAKVGEMQVSLRAADGAVQLVGEGKLFGGTVQIDTRRELQAGDSWLTFLEAPVGRAKAERMNLELIARAFQPDRPRRWSGTVSMRLHRPQSKSAADAEDSPTIQLTAQDVFVDGRSVSRRLDMQLRLRGEMIVIDHLSGSYAGGNLWARGGWSLGHGTREIRFRLARIDAGVALLPISHAAASRVEGKVSGTITLVGDDALRFRGVITAHHSSFFSVPTGTVHSGIRGSVSPDLRRWDVALTSIQGDLADGQITAEAKFSSSSMHARGFDLSSRWDVSRVNFAKLLATTGSSSRIANGRMTGSLSLSGRGIRSSSDLVGRFDARLGATQAAAVPGLVQADQFLGVISLAGVRFTEGHIDGVIAAGAASIDEFWLRSGRVKVWSDGKIQLANQRMDLNVVVSTGYLQNDNGKLLALASQLAIQSVLPVAAVVEVNQFLSNRTIHLGLDGPLSDPRIRLKPMAIIREEAAQFLLREILVAATASSGLL